jgi:hypothetical protein
MLSIILLKKARIYLSDQKKRREKQEKKEAYLLFVFVQEINLGLERMLESISQLLARMGKKLIILCWII